MSLPMANWHFELATCDVTAEQWNYKWGPFANNTLTETMLSINIMIISDLRKYNVTLATSIKLIICTGILDGSENFTIFYILIRKWL